MKSIKNGLLFGGLIVLMGVVLVCDIIFGSVRLPLEALWSDDTLYREIIYNFRLPKALTAVITGAAISVAGLIMQTLFRNPLAGPYVLGVSSGASLGVAVYLLAGGLLPVALTQSGWGLVIAAITGAVLVLLLVLAVSLHVRQAVSLLIIGIMFGQIAGSLVTILQNSSNPDSLKLFVVWTFGSLSAVGWNYMQVMLLLITVGLTIVFAIQKSLNGLLLGENYAQGLGINITRTRFLIIVAVALLAGHDSIHRSHCLYRYGGSTFGAWLVPHVRPQYYYSRNNALRCYIAIALRFGYTITCRRLHASN